MTDLFAIATLSDASRTALEKQFTIHHFNDMDDPLAWLDANGAGIQYVLTNGNFGIKADYLSRLPDLKLISSNGVGYDAIDTDTAVSRGILVTHTPNVLNAEVATTALMLLINCYRDFVRNSDHTRAGDWETKGGTGVSRSVDNRTIAILGLGRIGMTIAQKLAPFNPKILYSARSPKDVDFTFYDDIEAMARDADALICVAPGGDATHHLINEKVINALGPDGVLINVGRGSVVDETALIAALQDGRLGMAGLDVFENEPHIPPALRALPNVVLTPHIGSATVETRAAMGALAVNNLLQFKKDGTVISPVPECAPLL